ncbi:hypothetical protein GOP47_0030006 [Adiantum capillus-veneris]|nr:hypothetical protein GOP47_0030006 [Adiantum capillus-veneris]
MSISIAERIEWISIGSHRWGTYVNPTNAITSQRVDIERMAASQMERLALNLGRSGQKNKVVIAGMIMRGPRIRTRASSTIMKMSEQRGGHSTNLGLEHPHSQVDVARVSGVHCCKRAAVRERVGVLGAAANLLTDPVKWT